MWIFCDLDTACENPSLRPESEGLPLWSRGGLWIASPSPEVKLFVGDYDGFEHVYVWWEGCH